MLAEARAREIAERVLDAAKKAGAEDAEVHLAGGRSALTRFAANEIHQNVESTVYDVSLRAVIGKRSARTATTRLDDEGLGLVAKRAVEAAKISPEDPSHLPLVGAAEAGEVPSSAAVDAETEAFGAGERAAAAKKAIDAVAAGGFVAAGYVETSRATGEWGSFAFANTRGVFRHFARTHAGFSLTVQAKDSSGFAEASTPRVGAIDFGALVTRAVEKARLSADPGEVEPGEWDVVLEPAAVQSLTEFLHDGFSGRAHTDGDVWSAGLLGKKVFGENVTIRDDWSDPRNPGPPWDEEGLARSKLVVVDKGVLASLAWDRRSAKKAGAKPTGHGYRQPSHWGGGPSNLIVDGGTTSVDDMVKSTKRGILVTRFWYNRLVDAKKVILTGMTRDGTFLIEDGKLARGLRNMRFNQGVLDVLGRVQALSPVDSTYLVPAMKVSGFRFSSKTKF